MDLAKVLAQLKQELENLNAAIASLEKIEQSKLRRRGRPPGPSGRPPNPGKNSKNRKRP
jgi:hypothetical protein